MVLSCGVRARKALFYKVFAGLQVLAFCLGASKIVILKENGVVNGVVKRDYVKVNLDSKRCVYTDKRFDFIMCLILSLRIFVGDLILFAP